MTPPAGLGTPVSDGGRKVPVNSAKALGGVAGRAGKALVAKDRKVWAVILMALLIGALPLLAAVMAATAAAPAIVLDTDDLMVNETLSVSLDLENVTDRSLVIEGPTDEYAYLGLPSTLKFKPSEAGAYEVKVLVKDQVEVSTPFVVRDLSGVVPVQLPEVVTAPLPTTVAETVTEEGDVQLTLPVPEVVKDSVETVKVTVTEIDGTQTVIETTEEEARDFNVTLNTSKKAITKVDVEIEGKDKTSITKEIDTKIRLAENFELSESAELDLNITEVLEEQAIESTPEFVTSYVRDSEGKLPSVSVTTTVVDDTVEVEVESAKDLKPGLYKLVTQIVVQGQTVTEEQWFTWGLVSINSHKPIYHVGETSIMTLVVLDKEGYPVSDATIELLVTDPEGQTQLYSTGLGTVEESVKRGVYTTVVELDKLGRYALDATAKTTEVDATISSYVYTAEEYAYDIIRDVPATIDPWLGPYETEITVTSLVDNKSFYFVEELPASFEITDTGGASVTYDGSSMYLTWWNLSSGDTVRYLAQTPLISPYLYELGPARVVSEDIEYLENRTYLFAIDPNTKFNLSTYVNETGGSATSPANIQGEPDSNFAVVANGQDVYSTGYNLTTEAGTIDQVLFHIRYYTDSAVSGRVDLSVNNSDQTTGWQENDTSLPLGGSAGTPLVYVYNATDAMAWTFADFSDFHVRLNYTEATDTFDLHVESILVNVSYTNLAPVIDSGTATINESLISSGKVNLSIEITDSDSTVLDEVVFTIEGVNYTATAEGDNYTVEQTCSATETYDWTRVYANDTEGGKSIATLTESWSCDQSGPSAPTLDITDFTTSENLTGMNVTATCSATDVGAAGVANYEYAWSTDNVAFTTICSPDDTDCVWYLPHVEDESVWIRCRANDTLTNVGAWTTTAWEGIDNEEVENLTALKKVTSIGDNLYNVTLNITNVDDLDALNISVWDYLSDGMNATNFTPIQPQANYSDLTGEFAEGTVMHFNVTKIDPNATTEIKYTITTEKQIYQTDKIYTVGVEAWGDGSGS